MKSSQKAILIFAVVLVLIGLGMYHFKNNGSVASSIKTSSDTKTQAVQTPAATVSQNSPTDAKWVALPTAFSIYSNPAYGFSFTYPSTWKLTDSSDKTVTITSDVGSGIKGDGSSFDIPLESISFKATNKNFFNPHVNTKYGQIAYDEKTKALVDVSETPQRCLSASPLLGSLHLGGNTAVKSITYGGSLMSDPVHNESAVLTTNGSIVVVTEESERSTDETINKKATDQVMQIANSFSLLAGNTVSIPACANQ
jgi:hypothetical protein